MASRQFFEPMDEVLRPLEMLKNAGAQGFVQPQVIVPPGWYNQQGALGGIADALSNAFMQQRAQKAQQQAIQGLGEFWPIIQSTGGNEHQINALLASGMEPKEIAHFYLSQEAERANKGYTWQHEAAVKKQGQDEKVYSPEQMDVVQDYMKGNISLSDAMRKSKLNPLALHEAVGQLASGVNLQKSSLDLEGLPKKQQDEAHKRSLDIAAKQHALDAAPDKESQAKARFELEKARQDLNERRFQWEQNKPVSTGKGLSSDLQQQANTLQGLATPQAQYQQAIKSGLKVRPPKKAQLDEIGQPVGKAESQELYMKNVIMPALKNKQLQSAPKLQGSIPNTPLGNMAQKAAAKWGVDPDLFGRLVHQESGWNSGARSPVGAIGLTQLMPATAKSLKVDPNNPEQNLQGGARYLRSLIDRYGDTKLALVAYNGGDGAVKAWQSGHPYRESLGYVQAIMGQSEAQPSAVSIPKLGKKKSIDDIWSK